MKSVLFIICIFFSVMSFGQDSFSKKDAQQIVDTFFEGFHAGDTTVMKSVIGSEVALQTAFVTKAGENKLTTDNLQKLLGAIANRAEDQKWEERLLDYKIQIDGNLAHVWTPYEFWLNGTFSHCGANAFTLAKTDKGWKIIHLIDSRRRENCI